MKCFPYTRPLISFSLKAKKEENKRKLRLLWKKCFSLNKIIPISNIHCLQLHVTELRKVGREWLVYEAISFLIDSLSRLQSSRLYRIYHRSSLCLFYLGILFGYFTDELRQTGPTQLSTDIVSGSQRFRVKIIEVADVSKSQTAGYNWCYQLPMIITLYNPVTI